MAELFDRYAVDRVPRWPLMSRLVALSVVAHGLFLVAVVYVPSLRNLIRVAGAMSGIEFVSEDYDRTLLGQRATIVKLTEPYEKLYYPTDYFGAPPDPLADPTLMAQAAPPPPPVVIRPPRQRRQQQAQVIATPEPSPSPSPEELASASPTPTPEDPQRKAAEEEMNRVAQQYGVERPKVNPEPFQDLAKKGKEMYDAGKLDVNSHVDVTATAERNPDGTFKPESVNIKWGTTNDPAMAELAQHLVTALSQSKVLGLLKGGPAVQMALKLDQQNISVRIANEFPTEESAGQQVEGYALLLAAARLTRGGTDEGELYKNLKVTREGKQFVMTFEMPKDTAGKMIVEMLARKAAKDKEKEAAGAKPANGKG
jgi:hypothetical protein